MKINMASGMEYPEFVASPRASITRRPQSSTAATSAVLGGETMATTATDAGAAGAAAGCVDAEAAAMVAARNEALMRDVLRRCRRNIRLRILANPVYDVNHLTTEMDFIT